MEDKKKKKKEKKEKEKKKKKKKKETEFHMKKFETRAKPFYVHRIAFHDWDCEAYYCSEASNNIIESWSIYSRLKVADQTFELINGF